VQSPGRGHDCKEIGTVIDDQHGLCELIAGYMGCVCDPICGFGMPMPDDSIVRAFRFEKALKSFADRHDAFLRQSAHSQV
jgi:hypothetical protein